MKYKAIIKGSDGFRKGEEVFTIDSIVMKGDRVTIRGVVYTVLDRNVRVSFGLDSQSSFTEITCRELEVFYWAE